MTGQFSDFWHGYQDYIKERKGMRIKIYRINEHASLPQKSSLHAVGYDLRADLSRLAKEAYSQDSVGIQKSFEEYLKEFHVLISPQCVVVIPSGLKVELPIDCEMDIKSRSGLFSRHQILATGTIDPDYRGEIGIMLANIGKQAFAVQHGERIAQAIFRKVLNQEELFLEVFEEGLLSETKRSEGGFGSTGKS
jgi:dUTP pyrophosphatase